MAPKLSFILPTRKRIPLLRRFLESVIETASRPGELEVVLGVDEDDAESRGFEEKRLSVKKVVFPRGASMGALNQGCFEASGGRYVMGANDDVIVRTKDWDLRMYDAFSMFEDDVALIHVNDLMFRERLCTFPALSRRACLEVGFSPSYYRRYRIDDHIYDIYNLLAYLGRRRIVYLPDVVFEHMNFETASGRPESEIFRSNDGKIYAPDKGIIELDAKVYDAKLPERKAAALALAGLTDTAPDENAAAQRRRDLAMVYDSQHYRKKDFPLVWPAGAPMPGRRPTVTIGVVTASVANAHARTCLARLKAHTRGYELVILDNGMSPDFNHPREMNRLLEMAKTDYLVLMDDDVFVREGWLDALLGCFDAETGVVTPMYHDEFGRVSYSGAYFMGDGLGTHGHHLDTPAAPRVSQTLCSAAVMIDMKKCGHLRFDPSYKKYFHDIEFGLKVWEAGCRVVCAPGVPVTHIGGATMPYGSERAMQLWNRDLGIFLKACVESGRLKKLEETVWSRFPFLAELTSLPKRIAALDARGPGFQDEAEDLLRRTRDYPLFAFLLQRALKKKAEAGETDFLRKALSALKGTPAISPGFAPFLIGPYEDCNLVEYLGEFYAIPLALGTVDLTNGDDRARAEVLRRGNLAELKEAVLDLKRRDSGRRRSLAESLAVEVGRWKGRLKRYKQKLLNNGYAAAQFRRYKAIQRFLKW